MNYMKADVNKQIRQQRNANKTIEGYTYPQVFVFGSNEAGNHAGGAALYAYKNKGARFGFAYGRSGNSFAIPTLDHLLDKLPLKNIEFYVKGFIAYAKSQSNRPFKITQIGCGIAGFTAEQIAPLFAEAPHNCFFDEAWRPVLGDSYKYWGTIE